MAVAGDYHVVLMDCQMPVMDGYAATRAIRHAENRTGKRTRIVAMTANAMPEDRAACLEAGMDDYMSKPVTLASLSAALERAGGGAAPHSQHAVLDVELLVDLFGGEQDARTFLRSALPAIETLVSRLALAQSEQRKAIAHELKGAAGNVGAKQLASVAARIEAHPASLDELAAARDALAALAVAIDAMGENVEA
jgi:CheY-like chemotaxis protein